jgi:hypothetical protein
MFEIQNLKKKQRTDQTELIFLRKHDNELRLRNVRLAVAVERSYRKTKSIKKYYKDLLKLDLHPNLRKLPTVSSIKENFEQFEKYKAHVDSKLLLQKAIKFFFYLN